MNDTTAPHPTTDLTTAPMPAVADLDGCLDRWTPVTDTITA